MQSYTFLMHKSNILYGLRDVNVLCGLWPVDLDTGLSRVSKSVSKSVFEFGHAFLECLDALAVGEEFASEGDHGEQGYCGGDGEVAVGVARCQQGVDLVPVLRDGAEGREPGVLPEERHGRCLGDGLEGEGVVLEPGLESAVG